MYPRPPPTFTSTEVKLSKACDSPARGQIQTKELSLAAPHTRAQYIVPLTIRDMLPLARLIINRPTRSIPWYRRTDTSGRHLYHCAVATRYKRKTTIVPAGSATDSYVSPMLASSSLRHTCAVEVTTRNTPSLGKQPRTPCRVCRSVTHCGVTHNSVVALSRSAQIGLPQDST